MRLSLPTLSALSGLMLALPISANEIQTTTSTNTDPVPLALLVVGTALIGLWIWARRK